jgi:hypothetical protein
MTVAALIARLQQLPPDATATVGGYCCRTMQAVDLLEDHMLVTTPLGGSQWMSGRSVREDFEYRHLGLASQTIVLIR